MEVLDTLLVFVEFMHDSFGNYDLVVSNAVLYSIIAVLLKIFNFKYIQKREFGVWYICTPNGTGYPRYEMIRAA